MGGFSTFALVILALAVVTVIAAVKIVPQGYEWAVERFGRYRTGIAGSTRPWLAVPVSDLLGAFGDQHGGFPSLPADQHGGNRPTQPESVWRTKGCGRKDISGEKIKFAATLGYNAGTVHNHYLPGTFDARIHPVFAIQPAVDILCGSGRQQEIHHPGQGALAI